MATLTFSNHYKYQVDKGEIDHDTDSFKCILVNNSFTFDKDSHATYSDVSASELATGYGYTQDTKVLQATPTITEDDTNDRSQITFSDDGTYGKDVGWTASGGDIGPSNGMIIYDDTTSDDTVVCFIDFGSAQTAYDGYDLTVDGITWRKT